MTFRALLLATVLTAAIPTLAGAQATDPHQHQQQQQTRPGMQPGTPGRPGMMMMGDGNMMSHMMMGQMGPHHMRPAGGIKHVEGHIAFLKAELKITDAQQKPWDQFADALRTNAKQMNEMHGAMMQDMGKSMPIATRLERQEKMLSARMDAVKRTRAALTGLVAVLGDDQKKMLEELMPQTMPMQAR